MKVCKCTTGVVVSFFVAAAMFVSLQVSPAGAEDSSAQTQITAALDGETFSRSVFNNSCKSGQSVDVQHRERCQRCTWIDD